MAATALAQLLSVTAVAAAATDVPAVAAFVFCGRGAGQGWTFPSLGRVDYCALPHQISMLVPQAHLLAFWSARERLLFMAA